MPKHCIELGCEKWPSHNYPEAKGRITCKEHRLYGMIDVKHLKCQETGCEKGAVDNGYCRSCHNEKNGIVKRVGENTFKNYLKNRFPELTPKTEFYILCYRIDFLIETKKLFVAIEHDKDQHKDSWSYPKEKEAKRENEIFEELSKKKRTVIIRFNPNNYRIGGKLMKTPLEKRFEKLEDLISECIFDETKSGIYKLFYNE